MTYENKAKNKVEQHSLEFDHNIEEKHSNNAKQNKNIDSHTNQYENSTKIVQKIYEPNIVTKKPKNEASQCLDKDKDIDIDTNKFDISEDNLKDTLSMNEERNVSKDSLEKKANHRVPIMYPIGQ